MISTDKINEFKALYEDFKKLEIYKDRQHQKLIAPLFREIIWETLRNENLKNEQLTGLIQMFGWKCKPDNFRKYMVLCVKDKELCEKLTERYLNTEQRGFTSIGKTAVYNLPEKDLRIIKEFLIKSFEIKSVSEAETLCKNFEDQNIPQVKQGVFSPWLFYINPSIFPLVNDSHANFKKFFGLSKNYPVALPEYHQLKKAVNEPDFAGIDYFAHILTKEGKLNYRQFLELNGKSIYKISHGIFSKKFKDSGIWEILEESKWICMSEETKKGQGIKFKDEVAIGDFVYLCYGGSEVSFIAQVKSEAKLLPKELLKEFDSEEDTWIYREVDILCTPKVQWLNEDMKQYRDGYMPSGNTTIGKIPDEDIDWINSVLFIPYYNVEIIGEEPEDEEELDTENEKSNFDMTHSKNMILYGPPGTGKTFHSVNHAVAIVENKEVNTVANEERELVKIRFDQYVKDGQIVFCTFHQSLSYEDFIEGIKPIEPESEDEQLYYAVEDGIFKRLCTEAAFSFLRQQTNPETEKALDFSTAYDMFVDRINENDSKEEKEIPIRSGGKVYIESISQRGNMLVRHLDGSRNYTVSKKRLSKLSQAFPDLNEVKNIDSQFRAEIGGSNSSAYWAVLNAIRNQSLGTSAKSTIEKVEKGYSYDDKKEIIESFKADNYKVDNPKKFVLIIDEINRGNVSQIFGELITLIEEDKRLGKEEALKVTLPYSKESFGVPHNLYIVGTMNTADRSVEALDTALRRRFSFVPKHPEENKLAVTTDRIDLSKILQTINTRLRVLKDNDHTIGHAWLWNVDDIEDLKKVYDNKILPLLQEYFYNDYEKLGLVLGDLFFKSRVQISSNIFAPFSGGNGLANQYEQSWQYQLKSASELTIADFKSLENQVNQQVTDEE
jgi:hypothetical protein